MRESRGSWQSRLRVCPYSPKCVKVKFRELCSCLILGRCDEKADPLMYAVPFGSAKAIRAQRPRKEDRPIDTVEGRPKITAGLGLGERYSYLCLLDTESGEAIEEGRLRTTPEALRRRFASKRRMRMGFLPPCATWS